MKQLVLRTSFVQAKGHQILALSPLGKPLMKIVERPYVLRVRYRHDRMSVSGNALLSKPSAKTEAILGCVSMTPVLFPYVVGRDISGVV